MLIENLQEFLTKEIKGVFHIGAHYAEEKNWYNSQNVKNVVWFEANPEYKDIIKRVVNEDLVIMSAIGNRKQNIVLHVANNGQSSSILDFGTHQNHHPGVRYVGDIIVPMDRMSNLVRDFQLNLENYNFINLDIQGFELEALKSFDDLLNGFDYIYTEVNTGDVYKGCPRMVDIDNHLSQFGFKRVTQFITPFEWGDALYSK